VSRQLRPHQDKMVGHICNTPYGGVWAGMGSGKTASALFALKILREEFGCIRALVVAPLRVAQSSWPDEIAEWPELYDMSYEVYTGNVEKDARFGLLMSDHFLTITNKEMFPKIVEEFHCLAAAEVAPEAEAIYQEAARQLKTKLFKKYKTFGSYSYAAATRVIPLKHWLAFNKAIFLPKYGRKYFEQVKAVFKKRFPWDTVIFDDSPLRETGTNRWKAAAYCRGVVTSMIQMTGTPSPRSLSDVWAQVYLMDQGQRLGSTKSGFLSHWFTQGRTFNDYKPQDGASKEIPDLIADLVISLTEEDYANLPPRNEIINKVVLPEPVMKQYRKFVRNLVLEVAETGKEITAVNAAVLVNKLLQWCSGAVYDENKDAHYIHNYKVEALHELIENNPDENFLVAYTYKHELPRILRKIPYAEVLDTDPNTIKRWNNKEIRVLLAHPRSAGHGLNLQHGGRNAVWFSLTYDLELCLQFNKRLHRGDQQLPVNIINLIVPGTHEEKVLEILKAKGSVQEALMQSVKSLIDIADLF